MITIDQIPFETYGKAFDLLCELDGDIGNRKPGNSIRFETGGDWSFVVYPPEKVEALAFGLRQFPEDPGFRQAYAEGLELLEVCDGDYADPQYIALTPDVDLYGFKKQWLQNYCAAHGLAIGDCTLGICPADAFEQGLEQALRQAAGRKGSASSPTGSRHFQEQTGGGHAHAVQ